MKPWTLHQEQKDGKGGKLHPILFEELTCWQRAYKGMRYLDLKTVSLQSPPWLGPTLTKLNCSNQKRPCGHPALKWLWLLVIHEVSFGPRPSFHKWEGIEKPKTVGVEQDIWETVETAVWKIPLWMSTSLQKNGCLSEGTLGQDLSPTDGFVGGCEASIDFWKC